MPVHHDLGRLEQALDCYPREKMAAFVRSANRTATSVRRVGGDQISALLPGLKTGLIRSRILIKRATRSSPAAVLDFSPKRFRLYGNLITRQTKNGVVLRRPPWRIETLDGEAISPAVLSRGFIQRSTKSGQPNVWIRVGAQRYPITALLAPSVAATFRLRGIGPNLLAFGRDRIRTVLAQEFAYRLSKQTTQG